MSKASLSSPTIQSYVDQAATQWKATAGLIYPIAGPSTITTAVSLPRTPRDTSNRTAEELDVIRRTRKRFATRLASDHAGVLAPDVDTPFIDTLDVIKRLLPYHVFQQPKEDLEVLSKTTKGKKAAVEDGLRKDIEETRFALECFRRRAALQTRFRNAKIRSGKRTVPDDQAYLLVQAVLESDRAENALLNNELRGARTELERREKDKRAAAAAAAARPVYYSATLHQTTAQSPYYRGYPYAYAQVYGTPAQPQRSSTPTTSGSNYTPQIGGAIPVQLPVSSLPALHGLGIIPVPAASLNPDVQPQPAAVLRGSSANGTMLSLEINVSLLQSSQMSGLAVILNSLMSRASGTAPPDVGQTASTSRELDEK